MDKPRVKYDRDYYARKKLKLAEAEHLKVEAERLRTENERLRRLVAKHGVPIPQDHHQSE